VNTHSRINFWSLKPVLFSVIYAVSQPAAAALNQFSITTPGGFISAYAGRTNGASAGAGADFENSYFANDLVLNEQTFSTGTVTASADYSINTASNFGTASATGYVTLGALGYAATNIRDNHTSSQGTMNGGWNDSILFSDPALNGQSGTWMFSLNVSGDLKASGFSGSSFFQAAVYVNKSIIFNGQNFIYSWQATTDSPQENNNLTVNESVTFSVPFIWGTSFDLGIYAVGIAGWRSGSNEPGTSTGDLDFMNTLTWGGTSCVLHNGNCLNEYSLTSASGTNWDVAYSSTVPLPASVWLFGTSALFAFGRALRKPVMV